MCGAVSARVLAGRIFSFKFLCAYTLGGARRDCFAQCSASAVVLRQWNSSVMRWLRITTKTIHTLDKSAYGYLAL